jgi:hypothetical protein
MTTSASERIDRILTEDPLGMSAAARLLGSFRNSRGCHPSTLVRWCQPGVRLPDGRRLRLEHIRVSGRLMTSRAALLRFLAAQQDPTFDEIDPPRTPAQRRRDGEQAKQNLASMGVRTN